MCAVSLAACARPADVPPETNLLCGADHVRISAVQGSGFSSPRAQSTVSVRGVVTRVEAGSGLYLEGNEDRGDASRGLFVSDASLSRNAQTGQELAVTGRVAELGSGRDTLTSLVEVEAHGLCGEAAQSPLTRVSLPLDPRQREALEGMRLAVDGLLVLTDHYNLRQGEWTLSAKAPLRLPTEDAAPGAAANMLARSNRDRSIQVVLPGPDFPALPVGAGISQVLGVLGRHDDRPQLLLESAPQADEVDFDRIQPPAKNRLRVVSLNLLNYFNGDGRGGGFPTPRGASTPEEFQTQQERTAAAIERMQPHLLAVQELENDGFGPNSAARSLLDLLNTTGATDWAFVDPGVKRVGGDVITVGLFFRRQILEPAGPPQLLRGSAFEGLSRVPMAQVFRERSSGSSFLVAVNHLKSKGRCPDGGQNARQGDGQGCWNTARVDAVQALLPWLEQLAQKSATRQVLILGDMNAWRQEDPIRAYRNQGYVDLVEEISGLPQYSFLYFGQRGTLDYAFATPEMRSRTRQASIWHINADWPQAMALPRPWLRLSDHDPVVVDFEFSQLSTPD